MVYIPNYKSESDFRTPAAKKRVSFITERRLKTLLKRVLSP